VLGKLRKGYSLKDLTTWKAGGSCRDFAAPATPAEAKGLLAKLLGNKEPFYVLGGGSNVLIQDGMLDALVLHTGRLEQFVAEEKGNKIEVEVQAGLPVKKLLEFAVKNSLGGCEFLAGIPGTVGGALWGNAGAAGIGFSETVTEIDTVEADGGARTWSVSELNWRYRSCPFDELGTAMIIGARLVMRHVEREEINKKIRGFSNLKKGQPIGKKTAGCIFKNPKGHSAGKLLDEAGCKGMRVGAAAVSQSHANFIENDGDARASDIYKLCERCRARVLNAFGVKLEYEIRFIGEF